MSRLVAIVGPTAVGKSALAMRLAQLFNAEIVGADSRHVYRYVNIGTAKPTLEERSLIPHHLIDIVDPDEDFSLAQYQQMAYEAIDDVHSRGKLPLLTGGSGLYVRSVVGGFMIPQVPPDAELRQSLEAKAECEGHMALHAELEQVDPEAATRIDPRNVRRVIRALEVCHTSGLRFSELQRRESRYETLTIGLTTTREDLYHRIDERVDAMIQRGLIEEMQDLLDRGYSPDLPALSGLGYKQIGTYLQGGGAVRLDEVIQHIKHETHRFARHQYAWFRLNDETINWFDVRNGSAGEIEDSVHRFLGHAVETQGTGRI